MNIKKLSEVLYTDQPSENAHVIVEDGGKLARTDVPSGGGVTPEIMAQIENAQWKSESSEQLFSETVTTVAGSSGIFAPLSYSEPITADTLKVTFDGVEYICPKISGNGFTAYGGVGETGPDFTEFPFAIMTDGGGNGLYTETAGTYAVSAVADTVTYTDAFKDGVQKLSNVVKLVEGVTTRVELTNALQDGKLLYFYHGADSSTSPTLHIITGPSSTLENTYNFIPETGNIRAVIADGVFRVIPHIS